MENKLKHIKFAFWLMKQFVREQDSDFAAGDLTETFTVRRQSEGKWPAFMWLCAELMLTMGLFACQTIIWSFVMMKNTLKIVLRYFKKEKVYSIINLSGLSIGLGVFMLIMLFVQNELQFDRFHQKHARIFRAVNGNPADKDSFAGTPPPLGPALKTQFPEIEEFVRIEQMTGVLRYEEKTFSESRIFGADPSLFKIFDFSLVKGDHSQTLHNIDAMMLTERMVNKYFGDEDPIGKLIQLNDETSFVVSGVVEDVPDHSHFHFDFLIPFARDKNLEHWGAMNYYTYILMKENVSTDGLNEKFAEWAKARGQEELVRRLHFQPMTDIHFQFNRYNLEPAFNGKYIQVFVAVAMVILLLACINYINLSTARASQRAKEVGIRKTVGAHSRLLARQFTVESILFVALAQIIAFIQVSISLPFFNQFAGRNIQLKFSDPLLLGGSLTVILVIGLLSGAYPAFVLSSFKAVDAFRNKAGQDGRSFLRNTLVIVQFTISIALVICTMGILKQMRFIQKKDLGLNQEHVLNVRLNRSLVDRVQDLKAEFQKIPGVVSASANNYIPSEMNWHMNVWWEGMEENTYPSMWIMSADIDFIETLKIRLVEGEQQYNRPITGERYTYILNESALNEIGWEEGMGRRFSIGTRMRGTVLGIAEDFHFRSLHHQVEPCVIYISNRGYQISLRIKPNTLAETMESIRTVWNGFTDDFTFDYYFLDEDFDILYKSENKLSQLVLVFTTLSLFIACLGLFSLASFTAVQKTKEIGIRKVLGASTLGITASLSRIFIRGILIANLVAWPGAYLIMKSWLQNFAYATDVNFPIFFLAAVLALFVALLTVSFQTVRAALANPVDSLKYE